jgi:two-component system, NtrC family, sensor kinase
MMEASKDKELDAQLIISDRLSALGKMAGGIGHEINNPLAVIFQITGWMKDLLSEEDPEKCKHYKEYGPALDKIDAQIRRVRTVVHNMLSYAGKLGVPAGATDINEILNRSMGLLEHYARIHNIDIIKDFSPNLPPVSVNSEQLEQVFFNFISNAIDAVESDGSIHITTRVRQSRILVSIADDGPGIDEADQKKIFDPFFTTKVTGKGAGLGLWVNYSIIQKMGGTIELKSRPGQGAIFMVALPVAFP